MSTRQFNWTDDYKNIPFKLHGRDETGLDCYGLVRLILAEQKGIVLPSFLEGYTSIRDHKGMKQMVETQSANGSDWVQIIKGTERPFDVMVLRMYGLPCHIGMVVKKGLFIHIVEHGNVCCVDYRKGEWKQPNKITGIYRHSKLCIQ